MQIFESARKHEVPDDAIRHAFDNRLAEVEAGEEPTQVLIIGPDLARNRSSSSSSFVTHDTVIVIHAMPMRDKYSYLLPAGAKTRRDQMTERQTMGPRQTGLS